MGKDLKNDWKETGVGLGHAFRDLGKTLLKTGKTVIKKVDNWANSEEEEKKEENSEE